jgi:uncharacterized protein
MMTLTTPTQKQVSFSNNQDFRFSNVNALIIKVTKRCNLNCEYCYENITKSGDMDIETFREIAEKAFFSSSKKAIEFIFHGGEPTLLPDSWYVEAFDICQMLAKQTSKEVSLSIQTNLTHLTDEKIQLFRNNKVTVGASFDGPVELGYAMRPAAKRAIDNFFKARDNGLKVGVLMTINQSNFDKFETIAKWLHNSMEVRDFKANVVYSVGSGHEIPDMKPEEIFEAQKTIIDYMLLYKSEGVVEHNLIQQIDWFFKENDHQATSLCHAKRCGAGSKVLGITSDGSLLPCGRFKWNDSTFFLGNLTSINKVEEFQHKVNEFHSLNPENWFNCHECSAKRICGFGCQAFISRSKSRANVECLSTKMLYRYFLEKKSELSDLYQDLLDKQHFLLESYNDRTYGDGTKEPYRDIYEDKYKDS